ncbi:MAG: ThuA domain-containing protein [Bifidobacteriaceae bacterium]|jgi:hypothetical protein|nr:ThuA domain-containing protein [Bifidobacteriaceae bacterium]
MAKAVVLSGQGRYEDQWHDYAGTSHVVAKALAALGLEVAVHGLARDVLTGLDAVDLLVVNSGGGRVDADFDGDDAVWEPARRGLAAHIARGGPVLALHSAALTFRDNPAWARFVGAQWVDGASYHPPISKARIQAVPAAHPIAAGLADFDTYDERYTALVIHRQPRPYLTHHHEGRSHPLAWADEVAQPGGAVSRMVYNALGHGVESYGADRLRLLEREARWALGWPLGS